MITATAEPGELQMEWLGINGFRFLYRGCTVLLDPYVTRDPGRLCDPDCVRRHLPTADVVVVSHSHWDHLADVPEVARSTGAQVIGSQTTCNICRSFGVPEEQLLQVEAFSTVRRRGFAVTFLPSLHIPDPAGCVPFAGTYERPPARPPSDRSAYLEGGTFAVLFEFGTTRVLNVGSANAIEEHLQDIRPDAVLLSIAKWERTPRFVERVMNAVQPALVLPVHYDTMDEPLELGITDRDPAATARFVVEMQRVAPMVPMRWLGYFEKMTLRRGPVTSVGCAVPSKQGRD